MNDSRPSRNQSVLLQMQQLGYRTVPKLGGSKPACLRNVP